MHTTVAGVTASAPGTSTPSTDPPTTDPPVAPRSFTLAATGDLLAQDAVNDRAATNASTWGGDYDFRPMFDAVRPLIEGADLALCHLETPLARPGADVLTGDVFNAPHELAVAIEGAGYDGCSTASNRAVRHGRRRRCGHARRARLPQHRPRGHRALRRRSRNRHPLRSRRRPGRAPRVHRTT